MTDRFRLSRAGVLNVWQYDEQVFEFADGRLLLRGANGAGKSKTLEMLLPFVLDGDKQRMTASARHHTSLLWLMLDGYGKQNRAGYLWVEFARPGEVVTCGVGIRASNPRARRRRGTSQCPGGSARLMLEDDAGPLARERLRTAVEARAGTLRLAARVQAARGPVLFGLAPRSTTSCCGCCTAAAAAGQRTSSRRGAAARQALPQLDDDAVRPRATPSTSSPPSVSNSTASVAAPRASQPWRPPTGTTPGRCCAGAVRRPSSSIASALAELVTPSGASATWPASLPSGRLRRRSSRR